MPKPADKPLIEKGSAQFEHVADGASVLIGGLTPGVFRHGLRASKWGGRHWLDLETVGLESPGKPQLKKRGQKDAVEVAAIWRKAGKKKSRLDRWYAGSTEWESEFAELPDQPLVYRLSISPGTQTYHQPALTPEEIARGCQRPENVVDSFAIYAPVANRTLRADGTEIENYETGKLAHLYRPCWIAADGARIWATHSLSGDQWRVSPPGPAWAAVHPGPWVLDPTFGYDAVGASGINYNGLWVVASGPYTPAFPGVVTAVSLYTPNAGDLLTLGLYAESGVSPAARLGQGAGGVSGLASWFDDAMSVPVVVEPYWVAFGYGQYSQLIRYDSANTTIYSKGINGTYTQGALPNPFGTPSYSSITYGKISIYATYLATTPGAAYRNPFRRQFSRPFAGAFGA